MKVAKIVLYIVIAIILLVFVIQNVGQQVTIKFFSAKNAVTTEMIIIVLFSFVVGLLVGVLLTGVQLMSMKSKIRLIGKEYNKLKEELNLLRNKEIQELEE